MNRKGIFPEIRLGEIFKDRRDKAGISQRKAAYLTGCKLETVTTTETGQRAPRVETIWRLAALLCLSKAEVLHCLDLAVHHWKNLAAYKLDHAERSALMLLSRGLLSRERP